MNVKLLRRIKKQILAEPKRLLMSEGLFIGKARQAVKNIFNSYGEPKRVVLPNCGTVGCIAGWACVLSKVKLRHLDDDDPSVRSWIEVRDKAKLLLKLDDFSADKLFDVDEWPKDLNQAYLKAKTFKRRAGIAAKRIDLFVANGAE